MQTQSKFESGNTQKLAVAECQTPHLGGCLNVASAVAATATRHRCRRRRRRRLVIVLRGCEWRVAEDAPPPATAVVAVGRQRRPPACSPTLADACRRARQRSSAEHKIKFLSTRARARLRSAAGSLARANAHSTNLRVALVAVFCSFETSSLSWPPSSKRKSENSKFKRKTLPNARQKLARCRFCRLAKNEIA